MPSHALKFREIITKNETLVEHFLGLLLKVLALDGTSSLRLLDAEKNGSFIAIKISFSMFLTTPTIYAISCLEI